MATTFTFGKHKGKTLDDVAKNHPDYLQWLLKQDFFKEYRIYEEVKATVAKAGGLTATGNSQTSSSGGGAPLITVVGDCRLVGWGKYRDRPISDLLADEDYCQWLNNQPWIKEKDIYPRIRSVVEAATVSIPIGNQSITADTTNPVKFGKYKGKTLDEMTADLDYCCFLLKQKNFVDNFALYPLVKGVVERSGRPIPSPDTSLSQPLREGEIRFGKYRGQPEAKLLADISYCRWLISQPDFSTKNPELYPKVKAAVDTAPPPPVLQGTLIQQLAALKMGDGNSAASSAAPASTTGSVWAPSTTDSSWVYEEPQYYSSDDEH